MEIEKTIDGNSEAEAPFHVDGSGGQEIADSVDGDELTEPEPPARRKEILKALEAVDRDSAAIADSFSSLFSSLRHSLSQATGSTVEHMNCFSDAAGRLQESVLDASTKGNRYINYCLRLNEEMKGMDALATQLKEYLMQRRIRPKSLLAHCTRKILRRHVDALDSVVNRVARSP